MSRIILAVADDADVAAIRSELEDHGYTTAVVEGCDGTLKAVAQAEKEGIRAVVIDSNLVRILAKANRNIIEELNARQQRHIPVLVFMTKPMEEVTNPLIVTAVRQSDSVVHAPASPSDILLRLKALSTYGQRFLPSLL
jgi:CheY-like chemotaxis protein